MAEQYKVTKTSSQSAEVNDVVLSETTITRLVMRPTLVENRGNPEANVKIALVHQRKSPKGHWEDDVGEPLTTLKAGQEIKLALDSATTLELRRQLENLYALHQGGAKRYLGKELVVGTEDELIKTDAGRAGIIKALLDQDHSEEIWLQLIEANPDLATKLSYARIHSDRQKVLDKFQTALSRNHPEDWWQEFFEQNTWIFGYGLNYQILKPLQSQPHYGGQTLSGKGAQKGDFLHRTEAHAKFTVLVEIKKPDTALLDSSSKPYRNSAWQLGSELTGGVVQLQANCRRWETEGSRTDENRELLSENGIYSVQPKGILVIGHTSQLAETSKKHTFELFRRNLANPEILTFDELYERARFIVEHSADANDDLYKNDQSSFEYDDDIPF